MVSSAQSYALPKFASALYTILTLHLRYSYVLAHFYILYINLQFQNVNIQELLNGIMIGMRLGWAGR